MAKIIQYPTEELKAEWEAIAKSRLEAVRKIVRERYYRVAGLSDNDPPELWRFAVGRLPRDLTINNKTKKLAEHFQIVDPSFAGAPESYTHFRNDLGTPNLRETVAALVLRAKDDAELAAWLSKLFLYLSPQAGLARYI